AWSVLDRVVDACAVSVGVRDHQAVSARPAKILLVVKAATQRKRGASFPPPGHVIPSSIEGVFRARTGNGELAIDDRAVVPFEELGGARLHALGLKHHAHDMSFAGRL